MRTQATPDESSFPEEDYRGVSQPLQRGRGIALQNQYVLGKSICLRPKRLSWHRFSDADRHRVARLTEKRVGGQMSNAQDL